MALLDCAINEKYCSVGGGRGICPLFSSPPRRFDSSRVPTPGNLPSKAKKMLMPGGQSGKGGGLGAAVELTDAVIMHRNVKYKNVQQSFNPGLQANRPFRSIRNRASVGKLYDGYTVYLSENCFSQSKTKILSRETQNGCYMESCITCLDIQQPVETNL